MKLSELHLRVSSFQDMLGYTDCLQVLCNQSLNYKYLELWDCSSEDFRTLSKPFTSNACSYMESHSQAPRSLQSTSVKKQTACRFLGGLRLLYQDFSSCCSSPHPGMNTWLTGRSPLNLTMVQCPHGPRAHSLRETMT